MDNILAYYRILQVDHLAHPLMFIAESKADIPFAANEMDSLFLHGELNESILGGGSDETSGETSGEANEVIVI